MTTPRLLLDEHFAPRLARLLRQRGHDVTAVLEDPTLTGQPDDVIFAAATAQGRRIVTENIADFRPLYAQALEAGLPAAELLLVLSSRYDRIPARSSTLTEALHLWLADPAASGRPGEDWLAPLTCGPGTRHATTMPYCWHEPPLR